MKTIKAEGKDLDRFEFKPDVQKKFAPLDKITNDILDDAVVPAREIFYDFLNDSKCRFTLFQYIEAL